MIEILVTREHTVRANWPHNYVTSYHLVNVIKVGGKETDWPPITAVTLEIYLLPYEPPFERPKGI